MPLTKPYKCFTRPPIRQRVAGDQRHNKLAIYMIYLIYISSSQILPGRKGACLLASVKCRAVPAWLRLFSVIKSASLIFHQHKRVRRLPRMSRVGLSSLSIPNLLLRH
jgi:hypothetical protein